MRTFNSGCVNRERRQPLRDIVMQLTCNSASLVLMHHQQPSAQRGGLALSATTAESLPEKPRDQRTLQQHDCDAGRQVRSVLLPGRWLTESHVAAGGKTRFLDTPALQLLPVVDRGSRAQWRRLDGARRLAVQHADGNTGSAAAELPIRDESATHDTPIDIGDIDSEDRCIGCIVNVLEATRQRTRNSRSIDDQYRVEDCGIRWQFGDGLLHLFEGQLVEPDELDPVHEGLELALRLLFPELLHRRGANDHGHVGCLRQYIEDVLDEPVHVEAARDNSVFVCQCVSVEGSIVHCRIQRRNIGEEALPLALRKTRCDGADRHHQIRFSTH